MYSENNRSMLAIEFYRFFKKILHTTSIKSFLDPASGIYDSSFPSLAPLQHFNCTSLKVLKQQSRLRKERISVYYILLYLVASSTLLCIWKLVNMHQMIIIIKKLSFILNSLLVLALCSFQVWVELNKHSQIIRVNTFVIKTRNKIKYWHTFKNSIYFQ